MSLRAAVLAAVMVIAQTAALVHAEAEESHPAGEVCTLCVGLSTFGAANVSSPPPLEPVVAATEAPSHGGHCFAAFRADRRYARGPPHAS